jgi:hypothetical protein
MQSVCCHSSIWISIMHGVDGMLDGGSLEWKGIFFILFYSKLKCTKLWIRSWL